MELYQVVMVVLAVLGFAATAWWRAGLAQKQIVTELNKGMDSLKDHVHNEVNKLYDAHNELKDDLNAHKLKVSEHYAKSTDVDRVVRSAVSSSHNSLKTQMNNMQGLLQQILKRLISSNGQDQ